MAALGATFGEQQTPGSTKTTILSAVMKSAMARYKGRSFWDQTGPGLVVQNYENLVKGPVATGNFALDLSPRPDDLIDLSIYEDAQKLVQ